MRRPITTILIAAFTVALLGGTALADKGTKATNFTVRDIKGKTVRLSDYKDKAVFMSFWAVWCKPCLVELKFLNKMYKKYKDKGFEVLAISIDGPETQARVKPLVRSKKFKFRVAIDKDKRVVKLYNPKNAAPYSVLIKKGKVIKKREGFQVSEKDEIEKEIQEMLK